MHRLGLPRRLIALVAAYGLALQTLLAAVIAPAPDAAFASVICASDHGRDAGDTNDVPPTPGHGPCCPFCLLAGPGPLPALATTTVRIDGAGAPMRPGRDAAPPPRPLARAGLARAPPA